MDHPRPAVVHIWGRAGSVSGRVVGHIAARLALIRHGYLMPKIRRRSTLRDRRSAELDPRLADADWLRLRYLEEGSTARAIADEL